MKYKDVWQTAVRSVHRNPAPSSKLVEQLQQFSLVTLCLRQQTHRRFRRCIEQLKNHDIPVVADHDVELMRFSLIGKIRSANESGKPVLAMLEPTIIKRPNTIFDGIRLLRNSFDSIAPSILLRPHLSHSLKKKGGKTVPLQWGYEILINHLEQLDMHHFDVSHMRPIDMIETSVRHHIPSVSTNTAQFRAQ